MRVRVTAVLAVSALFLVSSLTVASAQTNEDKGNTNVTVVDCSQVQNVVASQDQYGDASATVSGTSSAEIAQELNISQNQVNECLGNVGGGEPTNPDPGPDPEPKPGPDPGPNNGDNPTENKVISDSIPDDKLPDTGGVPMSLLASGVALLLVGVSLVGATTVRRGR